MISWLTYHSLLYVVHLTMCSLCVGSELTKAFFLDRQITSPWGAFNSQQLEAQPF